MRTTIVALRRSATSTEGCSGNARTCAADNRVEEQQRRAVAETANGCLDLFSTWGQPAADGKRGGVHRPGRDHRSW
ncbi:hypothetical protein MOQ72_40520 [Saccharopolyspora sp. K220]|uniref:hypothetical protein n=1 Tax=Saccharopolyspora soli TaxID=2926618 RepID=UPI001F59DD9B|nr:hypothetical protein [Saccharopolyspora soli]MCI2423709.1 hypothetical protein [Saccharopolyspora soli]